MQTPDYSQIGEKSWLVPTISHSLAGIVSLPGSKSLTNRELVLSALASGPSELIAPLESRDSALMIESLRALGTQINKTERGNCFILPATTDMPVAAQIDCGLAGTVMRFMPPVAALFAGTTSFDGDLAARSRPMGTTIDSLRKLGVEVSAENPESLPFTIESSGSVSGGELEIDASASSQFVSGLLLAAPRFEKGLTLTHIGKQLPSQPHIEMTLKCLSDRGVEAFQVSETQWRVEPGPIMGKTIEIEPDLSNAGPFLAAALVAGGSVIIKNWPEETTQVGKLFLEILPLMGAKVSVHAGNLEVIGTGKISGIDIDLSRGGELAPVIIALAVLADGPSKITGIAHLRGHETDRLNALTTEINKIGGRATELADGIAIEPSSELHGGIWETYGDHRMATAAAILGLAIEGITVKDINVVTKTMPNFVELWTKMLGASN
ncbi:MAG: 3-phosphoshikimate 1-carboxyvinyltransferase [Acidobacteria bacterium]|nr:3-phosphoshikimate 1-carboxyvinyltransferase [Acidobacteriota bacterium]